VPEEEDDNHQRVKALVIIFLSFHWILLVLFLSYLSVSKENGKQDKKDK